MSWWGWFLLIWGTMLAYFLVACALAPLIEPTEHKQSLRPDGFCPR